MNAADLESSRRRVTHHSVDRPKVDSTLVQRLRQWWCWFQTGHHNLAVYEQDRWYLRCWHCGMESPGFALMASAPPTPLTTQDIRHIYEHMIEVELGLHGGG